MLMTKGLDPFLIALLALGIFAITGGAVYATQIISQDFVIEAGAGEPGNLILQDGNLGIGGTPGPNQLVRAEGDPNQPISFLVKSVNAEAVFNLRSFGGIPAVQLTDGDSGQKYRMRIGQPSEDFEIVDTTLGQNIRLLIQPNGNVGIGVTNPQEKLDVFGNMHTSGNADIDGNLNVDGIITGSYIATLEATIAANEATIAANEAIIATNQVTIADLLLRISALESGTDTTVPMLSMVSDHGIMIDANLDAIAINALDIESNAEAIEQGGGGPNPCDPDGDGAITAQELVDNYTANGVSSNVNTVQQNIVNIEQNFLGSNNNGILDSAGEVVEWNLAWMIPFGVPACAYP